MGYYYNGYYDNGYRCYDHGGCLAGAIIGAVVFFLIAAALLTWLLVRLRRQRVAAAAYAQQNPPYPDPYGPPPQYTGGYNGQPAPGYQPYPPPYQGSGAAAGPPPPPNFASSAEREAWEREQYAKYGEAGLVQGYPAPVGGSNGVQMTQLPNK